MIKKIVVCGALGHIGSRFIRTLPDQYPGVKVVMLDNLSSQRYSSLFNLPSHGHFRFFEKDVMAADLVPLFDGADLVLQLAAITNAAGSFEIREKVERENYLVTERVAQACLQVGAALINISSTSVYGTQKDVVDENCGADDLQPQSPYAETKLREEQLLTALGRSEGLRFVTCRFGTIFGVSPGMRFHTAVNKFCWQAVTGQPITVWRTALNQVRPYLDLEEAVSALHFIIRNDLFDGNIYNVLTTNSTVKDILDVIRSHVDDIAIEYVDTKIMNQLSYHVANQRFRNQGFESHGDLGRGIADTIALLRGVRS
ncbi:MAG: SDR family oxidoreductase [Rhodocyclales bacterium]|nr:SDR family oxidoreductase [Rhodocyclales bacterium]